MRSPSPMRASARERSSRRLPRREPRASASRSNAFGSEGNGRSGARARPGARFPSTGDWCLLRSRCSTTWSCTSSATGASQITHDGSGHSSSDSDRAGASSETGCAFTGLSFWPSFRTTPRLDRRRKDHRERREASAAPPFTPETAAQKVQAAEDAWNTRNPERVAQAYTVDAVWRNRDLFVSGRSEVGDLAGAS